MKILKKIFSRIALMLLIILIEIALVYVGAIITMILFWPLVFVYGALSVIVFFLIINRKGVADLKIPWIVTVLVLPVLGVLFYIFFANHGLKPRYRKIVKANNIKAEKYLKETRNDIDALVKSGNQYMTPFQYLANATNNVPTFGNKVTYYKSGEEWFPEFINELKTAKEFIFMEFFIIDRHSKYWKEIEAVLLKKASEGVEVRLLYDDIGCAGLMHSWYPQQMRKKGIKCYRFNPFIPLLSGIFNNRDHRKIAIIDHKEAFTGGMNLSDEYANEIVRFGYWKDAMVKIEGPAIDNLIFIFLSFYDIARVKVSNFDKYIGYDYPLQKENALVTAFGDGPAPFLELNSGESTFINMIENAKESVYISTPYFIPTENLKEAILRAGYRGIDVRILLPGIPDKKMVYRMALRYLSDLDKAGIKVYRYNEGFNHEKAVVVDGKIAFIGTINMDYRSLVHHFECGAIFMNSEAVKDVEDDLLDCFAHSELIDPEHVHLNLFSRLICAILNIYSQML